MSYTPMYIVYSCPRYIILHYVAEGVKKPVGEFTPNLMTIQTLQLSLG